MKPDGARLAVRVQPNAARSQIVRFEDGVLHLRIAAPPVRGKANRELIDFLSRLLDLPRSALSIEKGLTSRRKTLAVTGLRPEALEELLERLRPVAAPPETQSGSLCPRQLTGPRRER